MDDSLIVDKKIGASCLITPIKTYSEALSRHGPIILLGILPLKHR